MDLGATKAGVLSHGNKGKSWIVFREEENGRRQHSLDSNGEKKLVIDIGGGSTEFVIGTGPDPELLESVYIGTSRIRFEFFSTNSLTIDNFNNAVFSPAGQRDISTE